MAIEGLVSVYGHEFVHRLQSWGSGILIILFVVLTVRIFGQHIVLPVDTVHGGALAGAFVVMMTIALSQGISWATFAVTDGLADGLAKVWAGSCCQNSAIQCSRVVRCHGREGIGGFAAGAVLRVGRSASAGGKANEAGSAHRSGIAAYLAAHGLVGRGVEAAGYAEDGHGRVRTAVAPSHRHPRQVALAAIFHALLPPSRPS